MADDESGKAMHRFMADLFPINRSITGNGVRETLRRIAAHIPLEIHEVPSGTPVFDWTVPKEWNIRDAYVKNSRGERVIDFRASNLHVLNYSVPVRKTMRLDELRPHLFTLPEQPDWIPYRTSYYTERWGFCLTERRLAELPDDDYEVCIDSSLADGSLTYGEYFLPGESEKEVLFSCHVCHPSLANDNLAGIAVATWVARELSTWQQRRHSYRWLFIPATIGSITWLAQNEDATSRIAHGLVLSCLGDPGPFTYKKSRQGNAAIDRVVEHVLKHAGGPYQTRDFIPYGYDERQFCSPGFNLPVGCLMRTPNGCYPEYHTSADNLDFVQPSALAASRSVLLKVIHCLEHNRFHLNRSPKCEPQLGKRGLYGSMGGGTDKATREMALLWVLNQSDGRSSLLDIAERANLPFAAVLDAAESLTQANLLTETVADNQGAGRRGTS